MLHKYITNKHIFVNPDVNDKEELFKKLSKRAYELGYVESFDEALKAMVKKEKDEGVMELKPHILLPHFRGAFVKKLFVIVAVSHKGINYHKAKKNRAHITIFIGIPEKDHDYMKLLASISRLLQKDDFVKSLTDAQVPDDVIYSIKKYSYETGIVSHNPKKYLVVLSLNVRAEASQIAPYLAEVGVELPTEIDGQNMSNSALFIPFLSGMGLRGSNSKYNRTYIGLTDEEHAASKLNDLLKVEGINLGVNGTGSLFQVEVMESYGGFAEEVDL